MYNQVCSIKQVYEIMNKKDNNMKLCKYRTIQIVKCHTIHKKWLDCLKSMQTYASSAVVGRWGQARERHCEGNGHL